jgi:hypothetical protein
MAKSRSKTKRISIPKKPLNMTSVVTLRRGGFFSPSKIAGDTGTYRSFKLSDFTAGSDIVSAFKYYRVISVSYKYMLVNAPNNNATFPTLLVAEQDFAYSGAPGSLMRFYSSLTVNRTSLAPHTSLRLLLGGPQCHWM